MDIEQQIDNLITEIENEQKRSFTAYNDILNSIPMPPVGTDEQIRAYAEREGFYYRPDKADAVANYATEQPEPVKVKVARRAFKALRVVVPALLVAVFLLIGGGPVTTQPGPAEGAVAPCSGDGMSTSCSDCILTESISQPCGSALVAYRRAEAMEAYYMKVWSKKIEHAGVKWPVSGDEYVFWKQQVSRPKAPEYTSEPEPTSALSGPTYVSKDAPTTQVAPVVLTTHDSEFPLPMGQVVFLGVLLAGALVLATKHFSPSLYSAGVGKVHGLNSTVLPHAKDARRGLRKVLPGLAWMMDFKTGWGMVAKFVIVLGGTWYVWHALGALVGPWLRLVAIVIIFVGLGRIDARKMETALVDSGRWWEPKQFTNALLAAGIVAKPKTGAPEPVTIAVGAPLANDFGTEAKFDLPGALTVADVRRKAGPLAKALRVPANRLLADQMSTDPEGIVTVWIGTGKGEQTQIATVPAAERHDATQPFEVGRTVKGVPVTIVTRNRQTLLAGRPGMGKTFLSRRMVLHWLADPKGKVFVIDAKGDNDYVEGKDRFTAYVTAASEDAVMLADIEKVLTHVYQIVNDHNSRRRLNASPVLLVLEEWWSVLATAKEFSAPLKNRIDYLMAEISKKGRAANVHVLLISQEVRAESITAKIRSMFQQAMAFSLANESEQRMVFGSALTVRPAVSEGEVNVLVNGVQSWVKADLLDDPAWVKAVTSMTPREPLTLTEVKPIDPLTLAVLEVLEAEGDLEPKALFDFLPEELRTGTPATLGKALGTRGIKSEKIAGRNVYRPGAVQAAIQAR